MKKYIISIVSCVVLLGALAGLYVLNRSRQAAVEPPAEPSKQVSLLNRVKSEVTSLTIMHEDDIVTYTRTDGVWAMTDVDAPVEQAFITDISDNICTLSALEKVEGDTSALSGYGLDPAASAMTVTFADGSSETVRLGARTASRDAYYLMVDGDSSLYLVSNTMGARFSRTRADMLNRTMLTIQAEALEHIQIAKNGETMLDAYVDAAYYDAATGMQRLFTLEPVFGREVYVSMFQSKVADVLAAVSLGSCVGYASEENLLAYGFETPQYDIIMENSAHRYRLTVGSTFGEENNKAYAMYEGLPYIFEIAYAPIEIVSGLTAFDFMDKFVSFYILDFVDEIVIDSKDNRKRYDIKVAHEHVEAVGQQIAEHDAVTAVVDGQGVQEKAFRDMYTALLLITYDSLLADYTPAGEPQMTITFTLNDGRGVATDKYYEYDANFYAVDKGEHGVFVVNKQYVRDVLSALEDLKAGKLDRR